VEYLADLVANVPDGTTVGKVEEAKEAEKRRAGELTAAGQCRVCGAAMLIAAVTPRSQSKSDRQ
jgi:hypothetical protein